MVGYDQQEQERQERIILDNHHNSGSSSSSGPLQTSDSHPPTSPPVRRGSAQRPPPLQLRQHGVESTTPIQAHNDWEHFGDSGTSVTSTVILPNTPSSRFHPYRTGQHVRNRSSGSKHPTIHQYQRPLGDSSVKLHVPPSPATTPTLSSPPFHQAQQRPAHSLHVPVSPISPTLPSIRTSASHPGRDRKRLKQAIPVSRPNNWLSWAAEKVIMLSPRLPFTVTSEDVWGNRIMRRSPGIGSHEYDDTATRPTTGRIANHQRGGSAPSATLTGLFTPKLGSKNSGHLSPSLGASAYLAPFVSASRGHPDASNTRRLLSSKPKDDTIYSRPSATTSSNPIATLAAALARIIFFPFAFIRILFRRSKVLLVSIVFFLVFVYALGATRKSTMDVLRDVRDASSKAGREGLSWAQLRSGELQRYFPGSGSTTNDKIYGTFDVDVNDPVAVNAVVGSAGPAANRYKSWEGGRRDGRMLVKEGEKHPIPMLMARAKQRWTHLKQRQSKTFAQAVREYERRYGRLPPKGFDKWYAFAKYHEVQLIDEFNMIEDDLRIFRAFSGPEFRARIAKAANTTDFIWQIRLQDGVASAEGELKHHDRAKGVLHLLRKYAKYLPDMEIVYNGHDTARINVGWEERQRLDDLVAAGKYQHYDEFDTDMRPRVKSIEPGWGMRTICPPDSAARAPGFDYGESSRAWDGTEMPAQPEGAVGTVIDSFYKYMDVCDSPQYRHYHSSSSYVFPWHPSVTMPLFTAGVQSHFGDIHCIITEQFGMESRYDPTWEERPFDRLVWRGQTSGPLYDKYAAWKSSHRARLHILSHYEKGTRNITVTDKNDIVSTMAVPNVQINPLYLDTGFVGPAVQCIKEDGTCDEMTKVFNGYEPRLSFERASLYKYVGDFDGNSWSGRFQRLMSSNAAVVKATIYREFWTDWAVPWLHFIPVQVDYSDLWDVMSFFRGGPKGEGAHDHLGRDIAVAGKEWARDYFRYEDMEAFTFRQYLEFGRLYADDREAMTYDGQIEGYEPEWIP